MEHQIRLFAQLARENGHTSREYGRTWGKNDPMAQWYKGRANAYFCAARILKGGGARMNHALEQAVRALPAVTP